MKFKEYLSELKFPSKDALMDYKSKHKMRRTTKVVISGKETTVGAVIDDSKDSKKDTSSGSDGEKPPKLGIGSENLKGPKNDADSISGDAARENKILKAIRDTKPDDKLDLCTITVPGTNLFCGAAKRIPRNSMPQLKAKPIPGGSADRMVKDGVLELSKDGEVNTEDLFKKLLEKDGIKTKPPQHRKVTDLKSTQNQLGGAQINMFAKVLAGDHKPGDKELTDEELKRFQNSLLEPITISKDGYILDGHHRWAALVQHDIANGGSGDVDMMVKEVDLPITELLKRSNRFMDQMGLKRKDANVPKEKKEEPKEKKESVTNKFNSSMFL